jgi:hypothetical protein
VPITQLSARGREDPSTALGSLPLLLDAVKLMVVGSGPLGPRLSFGACVYSRLRVMRDGITTVRGDIRTQKKRKYKFSREGS